MDRTLQLNARAMEIVYAAHTQSGVFMLDERGLCRWAVAPPGRTGERVPERIVGAQYVATLDLQAEGGLVPLPRVGCPMLFAATDETGRVRLVRTPPLLRFEDRRNAPMRQPLASKFDDERTPVAPLPRPSSTPPESFPVPLVRRSPLPPPPKARIVARIPPAPTLPSLGTTPGSGMRSALGVQSIPVRVRSANMTLKKLARGT